MLVLLAFAAHAQVGAGNWGVVSTTSSTGVEHLVATRTVDASAYGYATVRTDLDCIRDEVEADCSVRVTATTTSGASVQLTPTSGGALLVDRASGDVTYAAATVPAGNARDLLKEQLMRAGEYSVPAWWGLCCQVHTGSASLLTYCYPVPGTVGLAWTGSRYEWILGHFDTTCE